MQDVLFHDSSIEPLSNKPRDYTIPNPVLEKLPKMSSIKRVEKFPDVQIKDILHLAAHALTPQSGQSIMVGSIWPKSIRTIKKILFIDRLQCHHYRSLENLILGGRYSDWPGLFTRSVFRDVHPLYRWSEIAA
jgi:hypothetical protein